MRTIFILLLALQLTSCATVFSGPATDYQKQKKEGVTREVQKGYLAADIILFCPVCIIVDFATGNIYKKEPKK